MTRERSGDLTLSVISDSVLGVRVVRGFARLCDLALVSEADIYDATTNPTGTQRDLSPKHARDAYEYVQREEIGFWPEIFLALRNKRAASLTPRGEKPGFSTLKIHRDIIRRARTISISRVDGNHRLHFADGTSDGYPAITKEVSFCLAVELTQEEEIKLFRDINNNQRRMSTSHLDNIQSRLTPESRLAQQEPMLYLAQRLSKDNDSPLHNLVWDGGPTDVTRFIPLRTLKSGLAYMFSRPTRLTALDDIGVQLTLIKHYFSALKKWQPDAWKSPRQYLMLRGAGLWGICFLGAEVIDRVLARGRYRVEDMLDVLKAGKQWDWSRQGDFTGLSGRQGSLKIRDMIVGELPDQAGISLKALARKIATKD